MGPVAAAQFRARGEALAADGHGVGAARMKAAARWRGDQAGNLAARGQRFHRAGAIVARAVEELALAALTAARALDFGGSPVPLALGGGLLLGAAPLRARVVRRIRRGLAVQVVLAREPALCAARALAREWPLDEVAVGPRQVPGGRRSSARKARDR